MGVGGGVVRAGTGVVGGKGGAWGWGGGGGGGGAGGGGVAVPGAR